MAFSQFMLVLTTVLAIEKLNRELLAIQIVCLALTAWLCGISIGGNRCTRLESSTALCCCFS